jgi:hypothetical protein
MNGTPKPYLNPYLAGILLGLVLLASYLILGAGLGSSGGLARLAATAMEWAAPDHYRNSAYFGPWGEQPWQYYLVFMLLGTMGGGLVSALGSGRAAIQVERGRSFSPLGRLVLALLGGLLVGFASRLARGCTSGQALTGGAMLLTGSLVFLVCLFAGGYSVAWLFRRQWRD